MSINRPILFQEISDFFFVKRWKKDEEKLLMSIRYGQQQQQHDLNM
jgi:hypothetical protein